MSKTYLGGAITVDEYGPRSVLWKAFVTNEPETEQVGGSPAMAIGNLIIAHDEKVLGSIKKSRSRVRLPT